MNNNKPSRPLSPEDLTAVPRDLPGGVPGHKPRMVPVANGTGRVVCSCGKWESRPVQDGDNAYTAFDAKRDFNAHADFMKPVNVDQEDFEAKRKAWGLTHEQMLEMAASVFQCVKCRREHLGSECHFHAVGAKKGELVSLERSWTLQCPNEKCRGELVRVKGASEILDKGRKFFSRLFSPGGKVQ